MERWRDVVGYEGVYQVSDLGRVRSVNRVVRGALRGPKKLKGRVIRLNPDRYGHLKVQLCKEGVGTTVHVHRLVLAAWVGPCPEGEEVRHGPAGVADNSVGNLCYGTRSENNLDKRRDGTNSGRKVVRSDGVEFSSIREAAEESGCRHQYICLVCKGRYKTAGGFGWKYCDN